MPTDLLIHKKQREEETLKKMWMTAVPIAGWSIWVLALSAAVWMQPEYRPFLSLISELGNNNTPYASLLNISLIVAAICMTPITWFFWLVEELVVAGLGLISSLALAGVGLFAYTSEAWVVHSWCSYTFFITMYFFMVIASQKIFKVSPVRTTVISAAVFVSLAASYYILGNAVTEWIIMLGILLWLPLLLAHIPKEPNHVLVPELL